MGVLVSEDAIPVRDEVRGASELLGIDPMYVACEGRLVAVVPGEDADRAVAALRAHPLGEQAAVELEQLADISETGAYPAAVEAGVPFTIRGSDLLHAVIEDRTDGVPAPVIAARFHHGVAALIEAGCLLMR